MTPARCGAVRCGACVRAVNTSTTVKLLNSFDLSQRVSAIAGFWTASRPLVKSTVCDRIVIFYFIFFLLCGRLYSVFSDSLYFAHLIPY